MRLRSLAVTVVLAATTGSSVLATADTTAKDALDYRKAVMTSMRGHVGAASLLVRGLVDDHGFLGKHAQGLANGAAELEYLFPAGSNVEDSEALPVIWEEPEKFADAIALAVKTTKNFALVVEHGDKEAIQNAFRDVGKACRGCHDKYREEHEHD